MNFRPCRRELPIYRWNMIVRDNHKVENANFSFATTIRPSNKSARCARVTLSATLLTPLPASACSLPRQRKTTIIYTYGELGIARVWSVLQNQSLIKHRQQALTRLSTASSTTLSVHAYTCARWRQTTLSISSVIWKLLKRSNATECDQVYHSKVLSKLLNKPKTLQASTNRHGY